MIEDQVRERILAELFGIEQSECVRILFACESGSRAWGFPSADSDYDVRFIYVHPRDWYLTIDLEEQRDVIERPISRNLDVSGWDIRKALKLLRKSNPPLLEWLRSPIVYLDPIGLPDKLRSVSESLYSPKACAYHYLHMARGNAREHIKSDSVWLKKYLYILRPLLAIRWIEAGRGPVPMEFERLVETEVADPGLERAIMALLARKVAGEELDRGPAIPEISRFIETELARHESSAFQMPEPRTVTPGLNELFRGLLEQPPAE